MLVELAVSQRSRLERTGGGVHLITEWRECRGPWLMLESGHHIRGACLAASRSASLRIVGDSFHELDTAGVAGIVFLADAHIGIRTWPASRGVTLDVWVCGGRDDDHARAWSVIESLRNVYRPSSEELLQVGRGDPGR